MWDVVWDDFADLTDPDNALRCSLRLLTAIVFGGILGYDRERIGKAAGLRTHMLVYLGGRLNRPGATASRHGTGRP